MLERHCLLRLEKYEEWYTATENKCSLQQNVDQANTAPPHFPRAGAYAAIDSGTLQC